MRFLLSLSFLLANTALSSELVLNNPLKMAFASKSIPSKLVSPFAMAHIDTTGLKTPTLPLFGENILLVVPTQNKFKAESLQNAAARQFPQSKLVTHILKVDSQVGEQPYNEAGIQGALNRTQGVLDWLSSNEGHDFLSKNAIGVALVGAIENFIWLRDESPVDYGAVVLTNATSGRVSFTFSKGVTIPEEFVREALRYGTQPNDIYDSTRHFDFQGVFGGNVTVGNVIYRHLGFAHDNWHKDFVNISRYDLLTDAVQRAQFPN